MDILKPYLQRLCEIASHGDAREESYYSAVEELLKEYAKLTDKKDVQVIPQPKKTEAGNPDFRIWDGKQHIVGYIEAKATSIDLDSIQKSEQIKRYLDTFPNLLLTNFLEFRLFRDGELIDKCNISYSIPQKVSNAIINEKEPEIVRILEKFFSFSLPKVYTSKSLAIELAKRTRFLRDEIIAEELKEEKGDKGDILGFYNAFKQHLIGELTKEEFADLYSQTITYGLFVARTIDEGDFNRKLAYDRIPTTLGLLKDIFKFISLGNLPVQMEWIIDDISDVLTVTDVKSIFSQSMHLGVIEPDYDFRESKDQIFHFYETFLAEYDPETRRHTGSYYTPEPVVQYIVNSINYILKRHLNKPDGFADTSVTVLDPAAGTLTFLYKAINKAIEESNEKHGKVAKRSLIRDHILNNFYAFEIKMAPYAIGHLRLSYLLESEGYKLKTDERIKLYLTNALEMEELSETSFPGMASLSQESHLAMQVKSEQPILVILGNPPYFGKSSNTGEWITNEIKAYYQVDGHPLNEKQSKWLRDDYVKFIRLAQWKIDQAGEGVLGFITNHSYLDNPTFRGMRQSLMNSFDEIYILDLHGSASKKEVCPDGSKDENVFDIMQGVAISIFIKKKGEHGNCKIHYSELWGTRESKYSWLRGRDISMTDWQELSPKSEFYLFIPRDESFLDVYEKYLKITDVFMIRNDGLLTSRDEITIKWTPDEVWDTVSVFSELDEESIRSKYNLRNDSGGWRIELAKNDLKDSGLDRKKIAPVLYRPFDIRYTYYTGKSCGFIWRTRQKTMKHMLYQNLSVCFMRQVSLEGGYNHFLVSKYMIDNRTFVSSKGTTQQTPLYIYPDSEEKEILQRQSNINHKITTTLTEAYNREPTPEEILYYIYSVLYSNFYRTKYSEFLRIDFPKIPFTRDYELFSKMGIYGKRLIDLHLLESSELDNPIARFQGEGEGKVGKLRYDDEQGYVYINADQYFEGVTKEIWEYHIGGYQVCQKWLKDRKDRTLSLDEIKHYSKIVTALQKTMEIQKLIDDVYPEVEKEIIESGSG
jgi:hypothetical protein